MKQFIKKAVFLCVLMVLPSVVFAQHMTRLGVEGNVGFGPRYYYGGKDRNFIYKENGFVQLYTSNFIVEHILPRRWFPNWMATSVRWGAGFMQLNAVDVPDGYSNNNFLGVQGDMAYRGLDVPIGLEVKFLLNDNIRFYVNGSLINFVGYCDYESDISAINSYLLGYDWGAGFELGFFRVGYKNISFANTYYEGNKGNRLLNTHTISVGFMFNGNRFLKKRSKLLNN